MDETLRAAELQRAQMSRVAEERADVTKPGRKARRGAR